jgi:hypothetical protein
MLTKLKLLKTINDLPDNFTFDELLDRLMLLQKVEIGIEQSKNGQIKSNDQAKETLKKWLT